MEDIKIRETIESLFQRKLRILNLIVEFNETEKKISEEYDAVRGYAPFRVDNRYDNYEKKQAEKHVDRTLWRYITSMYQLEKYMLCTEYEKMKKEIEDFKTPDFTIQNATGWLDGLKEMIYENVRLMCKRVYEELISGTYYTGSGYSSRQKKKRNNSGVDKSFILYTGDFARIFGYWNSRPTITDDLEKVCYLINGKSIPEVTLISKAKSDNVAFAECPYFSVKFCQNGNTHYKINEDTLLKLNKIGPSGNIVGQDIKIKIFDKWAS